MFRMGQVEVHGYAIVSDDDRIADASGRTPAELRNDADWTYFQNQLDQSALTVLGRIGHLENPNPNRRRRLIVSSSVTALEQRDEGWWWNPAGLDWVDAIKTVLPQGGRVAVPGGRRVFDLFLAIGYDVFHLTRAEGVRVPGGIPVFSACGPANSAESVLARTGLLPGERMVIDHAGPVSLTLWSRTTEPSPR
jgi:hypothetical protein